MEEDENLESSSSSEPGEQEIALEHLRSFFDKAGIPYPAELNESAPVLYVGRPIDELGRQVADHLRGRNVLFRFGRAIVTVDNEGKMFAMTAHRFRTWLPKYGGLTPCSGKTKDGDPRKTELKVETAQGILSDDELLVKLPELRKVNQVRLPVFENERDERADPKRKGFEKIALAPCGYHARTKTFTVHGSIDFDEELDPAEAVKWLRGILKHFPWGNGQPIAVQVAAMLTVFCRRLFSGNSPLFVWNSNVGGAGKSRLTDLPIAPVFGRPTSFGYDQWDQKELKSTLDAVAMTGKDYLRFDDFELPVGKQLRSNHLNRWITTDHWETRVFGKNTETAEVEVEVTTFLTGVKLDLEAQLRRRALFCDLFATEDLESRRLPADTVLLTKELLESEKFRAELLACMWSLVRAWDDAGRPRTREKPLDSFESWSALIPSIVEFHGFGNCLEPFDAPDAGDTKTAQFRRLVHELIRRHVIGPARKVARVYMADVLKEARTHGLFEEVIFSTEQVIAELDARGRWKLVDADGQVLTDEFGMMLGSAEQMSYEQRREQALVWQDSKIGSAWGKLWKEGVPNGRIYQVEGRRFQFGRRKDSGRAAFVIRELEEGEEADQTSEPEVPAEPPGRSSESEPAALEPIDDLPDDDDPF